VAARFDISLLRLGEGLSKRGRSLTVGTLALKQEKARTLIRDTRYGKGDHGMQISDVGMN